mmetsp:Transcript_30691/g.70131  ORF Transcript_30691/g.70131 Transcript_30691/m.70131 type:complete len:122 (-) Transcript_30691:515-880(-)
MAARKVGLVAVNGLRPKLNMSSIASLCFDSRSANSTASASEIPLRLLLKSIPQMGIACLGEYLGVGLTIPSSATDPTSATATASDPATIFSTARSLPGSRSVSFDRELASHAARGNMKQKM